MTVYSLLFDDIDKHITTPFGDVVWIKQKIANCADYNSDYTEITNKEDCLEVYNIRINRLHRHLAENLCKTGLFSNNRRSM